MPRKTKEFLRRSAAAKRGWETRRKNQRRAARQRASSQPRKLTHARSKRKPVSGKKMWRVTVAAPYFIRRHAKRKRRRIQLSPASAAYMVTGWFRTQTDARKNTPKLVRRAIVGRTRAVAANPNAYDPGITPDIETKQIPYRAGFIGRIEEVDEHSGFTSRRRYA